MRRATELANRLRISSDHGNPDTKPVKFGDGFFRFGPNLIFNCEGTEQSPFCNGIENCLPIGCPCGCPFFNLWQHRHLGFSQQVGSADFDSLAFHECLGSSTGQRLEIRG